ncbi:MAG: hypothetical protein GXP13_00565 [Gammaproteobacteria bacterium]|nr:hypothetical protein [Gammaproteobacteria bacterium]
MKTEQNRWTTDGGWQKESGESLVGAQMVLVFAGSSTINNSDVFSRISSLYPHAHIIGCTTAGEIQDTEVRDDTVSLTAIQFEHTKITCVQTNVGSVNDSYKAGAYLAGQLEQDGLAHVFVLSDGLKVNGSELVRGLGSQLPENITVTGGLSGDGARFQETHVMFEGEWQRDSIVVLGLYGPHITVGYASLGGWDPFGPERLITKSDANTLFELDGKSALELYRSYLGDHAEELPSAGLLFPLAIRASGSKKQIVRTVLAIDDEKQSMTFAGDVPEGHYAQLMKANFDRLVDGAIGAARTSSESIAVDHVDLAILISCVGRKLVLKQRIEEEIEGVRDVFGDKTTLTGFYSYGEISPFIKGASCELHNQTMTITTLCEQ